MCTKVSVRGYTPKINAHPVEIGAIKTLLTRAGYEGEFSLEEYPRPCIKGWVAPLREIYIGVACNKGVIVAFPDYENKDFPCKLSLPSQGIDAEFYGKLQKALRFHLEQMKENEEVPIYSLAE